MKKMNRAYRPMFNSRLFNIARSPSNMPSPPYGYSVAYVNNAYRISKNNGFSYQDGAIKEGIEIGNFNRIPGIEEVIYPSHQFLGAFRPFFKMKKDFTDTFKPYSSSGKKKRDLLQPINGLIHIFVGLLNIIGATLLLGLWIPAALFIGPLHPQMFLYGIYPLSWLIEGIGETIRGVLQLLTTPLTYLFKIPLRQYLTSQQKDKKYAEDKPEIQRLVREAKDVLISDMNRYTEEPEFDKEQLRFIFCGLLWRESLPSQDELIGLVKVPVDSSNFPKKYRQWGYHSLWEKRDYFIRTKDNLYYYSDLSKAFSLVGRGSHSNSSNANTVGSVEIERMLSMFDRYFPNHGDISLLSNDQLATALVITAKTHFKRALPRGYSRCYDDEDFKEIKRTNIETNHARQGVAARLFEIQRKYTKSINDGWITSSSEKKARINSKFQTTFSFFCEQAQASAEILKPQLPLDDQDFCNALDYLIEFSV